MNNDQVLYFYRCECWDSREVHLTGGQHEGAPYKCEACGSTVFLEWTGDPSCDIERKSDPVGEGRRWREKYGYTGRGGVVVVLDGIAAGWRDQLSNSNHWRSGCVAVDEQGKTWTGIGGTDQEGALMWLANEEILD